MSRFHYKAVSPAGEVSEGELEAQDRSDVIRQLQAAGRIPILAEPSRGALPSMQRLQFRGRHARHGVALPIARSLAMLLRAGVVLDRAFDVILTLEKRPELREVLAAMRERLRHGGTLSSALEALPGTFSRLHVSMIRTAEAGGRLDSGLQQLADYLERQHEFRQRLIGALIYPMILTAVMALSLTILLAVVVPRFEPLFADMGAALPLPTRVVLGISNLVAEYWWLLAAGTVLLAAGLRHWLRDAQHRERVQRTLLALPWLGALAATAETARLTRSLGTLLAGGVPMLSSLSLTRETLGNLAMLRALDEAIGEVKQGGRLSIALAQSGLFPALALQMIRIGEETGGLGQMLLGAAEVLERDLTFSVQRMLALLEPALIVGLGLTIATIVLALMAGIMSLNELPL